MIKEYLEDSVSLTLLSKKYIYDKSKVKLMISRFKRHDEYGLEEVSYRNKSYTKEFKLFKSLFMGFKV